MLKHINKRLLIFLWECQTMLKKENEKISPINVTEKLIHVNLIILWIFYSNYESLFLQNCYDPHESKCAENKTDMLHKLYYTLPNFSFHINGFSNPNWYRIPSSLIECDQISSNFKTIFNNTWMPSSSYNSHTFNIKLRLSGINKYLAKGTLKYANFLFGKSKTLE